MIDTVKKALLAGVGAAVVTKDKIEHALDEFVRQGKVSADEARAMAERIAADGRKEFEQVSDTLGAKVDDLLARSEKNTLARIATLEERVRLLEAKAGAQSVASGEP